MPVAHFKTRVRKPKENNVRVFLKWTEEQGSTGHFHSRDLNLSEQEKVQQTLTMALFSQVLSKLCQWVAYILTATVLVPAHVIDHHQFDLMCQCGPDSVWALRFWKQVVKESWWWTEALLRLLHDSPQFPELAGTFYHSPPQWNQCEGPRLTLCWQSSESRQLNGHKGNCCHAHHLLTVCQASCLPAE